jgi:signal transduction histidine kinase
VIKRLIARVFLGLQFRLVLLVVLASAPLVALALHTAWEDRRREIANWQGRAERMTEIAKQQEEEIVGGTRQLLLAMAESAPARMANRRGCQKLVDELFVTYPRYANLGVIKTNGEVLASSKPLGDAYMANRPFFRRAMQTHGFVIGAFPSWRPAGRPGQLHFGYPSFDRTGEIQGVVFATLDSKWFSGSDLPKELPAQAAWAQIDRNGNILLRYPDLETWMGRPFPDPTLVKTVFNHPSGVTESLGSQGVPYVHAFVSMPSRLVPGAVATVLSIPKPVLFAQADRVLRSNLTSWGAALGFALALGWLGSKFLVVRPIKALVKSSARLAAGDLSARTGLAPGRDELGQLTLAFDRMATALEYRQTEQRRANHKLQVLSHRLVEVQESERRQIARELHDEIGQSLTAAEMNLQAALRSPTDPSVERRLEESLESVERVLEQVHDLSLSLRPSMLDDLGLEPALRWYTQRQAKLASLKAEFYAEPLEERLDPIIETECFRVAQEALTNVVRHARSSAVAVRLSSYDGELHLRVRDNGIGFAVPAVRERAVQGASLGLLSMEERASLAGGGLQFNSAPGKGTEVHAWFPLRWKQPPALLQDTAGNRASITEGHG